MMNRTHFTNYVLLSIFSALMLLVSSTGRPQPGPSGDQILSFGMKEIDPNNKALTRSEALKECLTDALRQYVSRNVAQKLFEQNDTILKSRIYDNYSLFLSNYRIKEEKEEEGFYKITAEVSINKARLNQKLSELGFAREEREKPVILPLVSDFLSIDSNQIESSWWVKSEEKIPSNFIYFHEKLEKRLSAMGFPVAEKGMFFSRLDDAKVSLQKKIIKGDIDTIRRFEFADVMILGSLGIKFRKTGSVLSPRYISSSLTAINLHNSIRLSSMEKDYDINRTSQKLKEDGKPADFKDVIESITDQISSDFVESFLGKWYQSSTNVKTVYLDLYGVTDFKQYSGIKSLLEEIKPEVVNFGDFLMQKRFIRLRLELNGDIRSLARKLSKKKVGDYSIEVLKTSTQGITIGFK